MQSPPPSTRGTSEDNPSINLLRDGLLWTIQCQRTDALKELDQEGLKEFGSEFIMNTPS